MVVLDGNTLTLDRFRAVVYGREKVELGDVARSRMKKTRGHVERAIKGGERVYSINTGFGILSKVTIPPESLTELQGNLIRSHCAGVGPAHTEAESRAILLLRTNVLAKGFSGVRPIVVDTLMALLNAGVHPVIPTKGSVGASGDLAPLAHLASVLLGEGEAYFEGVRMKGGDALRRAKIEPLELHPKEGLSLINGTQQMTAMGAILLLEACDLADLADLVCATSLEGVMGSHRAFFDWVHETRPYEGQRRSAANLRLFLEDSEIAESHKDCERVQDPYSFRCAPQVHGSSRDMLDFVARTVFVEMNAATDNPLVHPDTGELVSNGNFHGQPIAAALDILAMAVAEFGSISERRISKLIDPGFSELPAFLVKNEGLHSGFMMAQVTAAALASENKLLSHPASTDTIPTSNEKEDHVSMGPIAAVKARTVVDNVRTILAIEALAACQALEFRRPLRPGRGVERLQKAVRRLVPPLDRDRYLSPDINAIDALFREGGLAHQPPTASLSGGGSTKTKSLGTPEPRKKAKVAKSVGRRA